MIRESRGIEAVVVVGVVEFRRERERERKRERERARAHNIIKGLDFHRITKKRGFYVHASDITLIVSL